MALFKKKEAQVQEPMDLESVMKKFDRESNTRIWEGKGRLAVNIVLACFSLFCIYVTLFATWLDELRLTSFMAFIMFIAILFTSLMAKIVSFISSIVIEIQYRM